MFVQNKVVDGIRNVSMGNIEQYINDIKQGDISGLENLYTETSTAIYGYALSFLKNTHDAQDVVHDCYIKVYQSAVNYTSQNKPLAWMLTITRNLCLERLKAKKRYVDRELEDFQMIEESDNLSIEQKETLIQCLRILSLEERQIVILHAMSGFKHREIASIMELPLATVLSKYSRAMKKLKEKLLEDEYES